MADTPGLQRVCRPAGLHALVACTALLAACAGTPVKVAPVEAPAQASLQELMQQAQNAQRDGQRERARQSWRAAAKAYPTQKAPWQRLAEDYFDTGDYGNAILAAQEVLQRDDQDTLAHSVLAVSGLRLSTVSLVALRERTSYPVGSRDEAVSLTKAMRDALGETALVPQRVAEPARGGAAAGAAPAAVGGGTATAAPPRAATTAAKAAAAAGSAPAATPRAAAAAPRGTTAQGSVVPVTTTPTPATKPATKPAASDPFKLLK